MTTGGMWLVMGLFMALILAIGYALEWFSDRLRRSGQDGECSCEACAESRSRGW